MQVLFIFSSVFVTISCKGIVPEPRTMFCDECSKVTITSSGSAASAHPDNFGTYQRQGKKWKRE